VNLGDKRKELDSLKDKKKKLVDKKNEILNRKFGPVRSFIHFAMTSIVFVISFDLFIKTVPLLTFISTFMYLCLVPGIFYHKNMVNAKILDVDIGILDNNINSLSSEIRNLELKNLEEMVSKENMQLLEESLNEVKKIKSMPLFDRENIENNISNPDLGMTLSLRR
jgi:hypothetical protein